MRQQEELARLRAAIEAAKAGDFSPTEEDLQLQDIDEEAEEDEDDEEVTEEQVQVCAATFPAQVDSPVTHPPFRRHALSCIYLGNARAPSRQARRACTTDGNEGTTARSP